MLRLGSISYDVVSFFWNLQQQEHNDELPPRCSCGCLSPSQGAARGPCREYNEDQNFREFEIIMYICIRTATVIWIYENEKSKCLKGVGNVVLKKKKDKKGNQNHPLGSFLHEIGSLGISEKIWCATVQ